MKDLEIVQMKATKLVSELRKKSYKERLRLGIEIANLEV